MSSTLPPFAFGDAREFSTTHWSLVLRAGGPETLESKDALEQLCRTYWYPLYAYVRRQGQSPENACDLTQEFFARLIEKRFLRLANPERGRFRTFLLSSLKNFLITAWTKARAEKRGGKHTLLSLSEQDAEGRYLAEPADNLTPERIYERQWATTLLQAVLERLRESYVAGGKSALFDALSPYVWSEPVQNGYASLALQLALTEGATRVAMHRMRETFRLLLRQEVASTVEFSNEVDNELRYLVQVLRSSQL